MKNFAEMMKQAQALQGRVADMQAELERTQKAAPAAAW
jgi:DNA-binding protein YbaB